MLHPTYLEYLNRLSKDEATFKLAKGLYHVKASGECRRLTMSVLQIQKEHEQFDCPCMEGIALKCSIGPCPYLPWAADVIPIGGKQDGSDPLINDVVIRIYKQIVALTREFEILPCVYKSGEDEPHPAHKNNRICFAPQPNKKDWEKEIHVCALVSCPLNNPIPEDWGEEEENHEQ